jgi:chemotaxis signal transduction protein
VQENGDTRGRRVQQQVAEAEAGRPAEEVVQLLCVAAADYRCGLPLDVVLEIHAAVELAPLPDAPQAVRGLLNRRGQPLAVLDLRRRLGLPVRPVQTEDRLVVLQLSDRQVALLVDAAVDVLEVSAAAVDEAVAAASAAAHSSGVAVLPDGLLVVLDVAALLSATEATALDEALLQALGPVPA